MKLIFILFSAFSLLITGCDDVSSNPESEKVTKISYVRNGGGDKEFTVEKEPAANAYKVNITRFNFRKVSKVFQLPNTSENTGLIELLNIVFSGQAALKGDYKPSTLETGTWVNIYAVTRSEDSVNVTSTVIRDRLFPLEDIVIKEME